VIPSRHDGAVRWLKLTMWVVVLIVVFDVVGVVLTVGADLLGLLHWRLETSTPLGYVVWFVTGVFCSLAIYGVAGGMDDSPQARRRGWEAAAVTLVCAPALLGASSVFWVHGTDVAVAPDSPSITVTYLLTVVFGVAWWRIGVFSARGPVRLPSLPAVSVTRPAPPIESSRPADHVPADRDGFRRAGFFGTCGWVLGTPVLLFLVASIFVLAPFHGLMRPWTDQILTGALLVGPVWGFLAARWETPRDALLAVHAPLLVGSVLWFLTAMVASPLVGIVGLPDRVATVGCAVMFFLGFLLGMAAFVGWVGDLVVRHRAHRALVPEGPVVRP
jgi:hypothetical protein